MIGAAILNVVLALVAAPLLTGIINKTKAFFAGRSGPPILQSYYDLYKLMRKGVVYSQTTTLVFRIAPLISLACVLVGVILMPLGRTDSLIYFSGDFIVFAYFLGLMRFFTVLGALDTGSSFEGMGASREVTFSALAEPIFFICLGGLAIQTGTYSLTGVFQEMSTEMWHQAGPALVIMGVAIFIMLLAENCRIPVDDPNTHLELTMIHEVMVLDSSGPDFGFILYASALKLWLFGSLLIGILIPFHTSSFLINTSVSVVGMLLLAVLVGVVESTMARLRLLHVPQLLLGAMALSILALVLLLR
jgi:formate hydrogenlyase subunit 4